MVTANNDGVNRSPDFVISQESDDSRLTTDDSRPTSHSWRERWDSNESLVEGNARRCGAVNIITIIIESVWSADKELLARGRDGSGVRN